ncbi:hypothetical protein [Lysinibacillus fusiformis]|uniref:hypothetical protein n=1 Tax=Lysinibacillus fusiformis TaxID=28031 RepID=UPI0023A972A1|nr:hypothetical protein [Lysinibacillus fusiformis]WEA41176.1 hypothetical protein PWJ66_09635 [Lysinibacillus fusiformis]
MGLIIYLLVGSLSMSLILGHYLPNLPDLIINGLSIFICLLLPIVIVIFSKWLKIKLR